MIFGRLLPISWWRRRRRWIANRRQAEGRAREGARGRPGRDLPGLGPACRHAAGASRSRARSSATNVPLQNRVDPFGELIATPARGLIFGNRGGRFHRDDRTLGKRRWASRQWICCVLRFKGRHHPVWRDRYTALFFLDEPTAFAAGHRPVLRMPPRGRERVRARNGRRRKAATCRARPRWIWCCRASGSTAARSGRTNMRFDEFAGRRVRRAERCRLRGARRASAALERRRLHGKNRASARRRERSHAAEHRRCSGGGLSAAMASDATRPPRSLPASTCARSSGILHQLVGRPHRTALKSPPQFGQRLQTLSTQPCRTCIRTCRSSRRATPAGDRGRSIRSSVAARAWVAPSVRRRSCGNV